MTRARDENLADYFAQLLHYRDEQLAVGEVSFSDGFVLLCLKIVAKLLGEYDLPRAMAKELSLIFSVKEGQSTEEALCTQFADIEQDIEEHLRGFSGIMEWILEDTRIRRDPAIMLLEIEDLEQHLAALFCRLARALSALLELEEAYVRDFPKAAAVIFLRMLVEIKRNLLLVSHEDAHAMLRSWLLERVSNKGLSSLNDQAYVLFEDGCGLPHPSMSSDLLVVLLCFWSADFHVLEGDEAALIDSILRSMDMMGIEPLVAAGFLELKECVKDNKVCTETTKLFAT